MRKIVALVAVLGGIAVSLGVLTGVGAPVQAESYTVGLHNLKDKNANDPAVLANSNGMTLYYYSDDTKTRSRCTGTCAKTWRPLISSAPTKDPKIRGSVGVTHTVHGSQVTYNGHLLYTYSGDKEPGTAMGYGKAGKWFAATPALAAW